MECQQRHQLFLDLLLANDLLRVVLGHKEVYQFQQRKESKRVTCGIEHPYRFTEREPHMHQMVRVEIVTVLVTVVGKTVTQEKHVLFSVAFQLQSATSLAFHDAVRVNSLTHHAEELFHGHSAEREEFEHSEASVHVLDATRPTPHESTHGLPRMGVEQHPQQPHYKPFDRLLSLQFVPRFGESHIVTQKRLIVKDGRPLQRNGIVRPQLRYGPTRRHNGDQRWQLGSQLPPDLLVQLAVFGVGLFLLQFEIDIGFEGIETEKTRLCVVLEPLFLEGFGVEV